MHSSNAPASFNASEQAHVQDMCATHNTGRQVITHMIAKVGARIMSEPPPDISGLQSLGEGQGVAA